MDIKNNILISGCGGGYDIFVGLPLYFKLTHMGYTCYLASFGSADNLNLDKIGSFYVVTPNKQSGLEMIFPEQLLANTLGVNVYLYSDYNLATLKSGYQTLIHELNINTTIIVDGGCDSLLTGDEINLASPLEDYMTLAAVRDINNCYLLCCGVDVEFQTHDNIEGILEQDFNHAMSYLSPVDCGRYNLEDSDTPYVQKYIDTVLACIPERTLINSSIICSIWGIEGPYRPAWMVNRFGNNKFLIRHTTANWYIFLTEDICRRNKLLPHIVKLDRWQDIDDFITNYNDSRYHCDDY